MNIFYLHEDPVQNAKWHIDKHIVKMPIEYAQLMSTAHRMLDGWQYVSRTKNGHKIKRWKMINEHKENLLYKASHVNHPSAQWVRESKQNYMVMWKIYMATLAEYTNRYGRVHGSSRLAMDLMRPPKLIKDKGLTALPQCMPEYCKVENDPIQAYRTYYIMEKNSFASWKNRETPEWFKNDTKPIC